MRAIRSSRLNEAFNADPRPHKVNLSIGIYFDDDGRIPVLDCVRAAEAQLLARRAAPSRTCRSKAPRLRGAPCRHCCSAPATRRSSAGASRRSRSVGSSGGLKVGADFIERWFAGQRASGSATRAGTTTARCSRARGLDGATPTRTTTRPAAACASTRCWPRCARCRAQSIVLLHACCHNPTGVDLTRAQWDAADAGAARARADRPTSTSPTRATATASRKTPTRCARWPARA